MLWKLLYIKKFPFHILSRVKVNNTIGRDVYQKEEINERKGITIKVKSQHAPMSKHRPLGSKVLIHSKNLESALFYHSSTISPSANGILTRVLHNSHMKNSFSKIDVMIRAPPTPYAIIPLTCQHYCTYDASLIFQMVNAHVHYKNSEVSVFVIELWTCLESFTTKKFKIFWYLFPGYFSQSPSPCAIIYLNPWQIHIPCKYLQISQRTFSSMHDLPFVSLTHASILRPSSIYYKVGLSHMLSDSNKNGDDHQDIFVLSSSRQCPVFHVKTVSLHDGTPRDDIIFLSNHGLALMSTHPNILLLLRISPPDQSVTISFSITSYMPQLQVRFEHAGDMEQEAQEIASILESWTNIHHVSLLESIHDQHIFIICHATMSSSILETLIIEQSNDESQYN